MLFVIDKVDCLKPYQLAFTKKLVVNFTKRIVLSMVLIMLRMPGDPLKSNCRFAWSVYVRKTLSHFMSYGCELLLTRLSLLIKVSEGVPLLPYVTWNKFMFTIILTWVVLFYDHLIGIFEWSKVIILWSAFVK